MYNWSLQAIHHSYTRPDTMKAGIPWRCREGVFSNEIQRLRENITTRNIKPSQTNMAIDGWPWNGHIYARDYIVSHHIISCHVKPYNIISYQVISYHIISTISYHINHIVPYHIVSYHIKSSHLVSYHIISNHIILHISYHVISYHFI